MFETVCKKRKCLVLLFFLMFYHGRRKGQKASHCCCTDSWLGSTRLQQYLWTQNVSAYGCHCKLLAVFYFNFIIFKLSATTVLLKIVIWFQPRQSNKDQVFFLPETTKKMDKIYYEWLWKHWTSGNQGTEIPEKWEANRMSPFGSPSLPPWEIFQATNRKEKLRQSLANSLN